MDIGSKLKELRTERDMSMDTLISKLNSKYNLNITKSMMSRWENNLSEPSNKFVAAYAKFFNIDLNYLVGLTDEKKPIIGQTIKNDEVVQFFRIDTSGLNKEDIEEIKTELERYTGILKEAIKGRKSNN